MTPKELREAIAPSEDEDRLTRFLDLSCGGDAWEESQTAMTGQEWASYCADSMVLAMGQCPKCHAPVHVVPLADSKLISSFNCTRFLDHTFIRAVPINTGS